MFLSKVVLSFSKLAYCTQNKSVVLQNNRFIFVLMQKLLSYFLKAFSKFCFGTKIS